MNCIILLSIIYGTLAVQLQDDGLQEFVNGNHKFTADIYKESLKTIKGNYIVSPLSAEIVLALTNEGARGDTSKELVTALSLPNTTEKIQRALKSLLPSLKQTNSQLQLLSANKIYVAKDLSLEDDFKAISTNLYDAGVENVDFSQNIKTSAQINNWVENNTNHKIRDLIKPMDLDENTRMVLVNALYLKGKWVSIFNDHLTQFTTFHLTKDDIIFTKLMRQSQFFNYYENQNLNAKFLELPYEGGNVSMVIVLPNEIDGLANLERNIAEALVPQPFRKQFVHVTLPKFTIESQINFVPILSSLGVRKLFEGGDLSGLSSTDKNLSVSQVIQKTIIKVTESGTEAAAATAVLTMDSDVSPPPSSKVFKADHPFFFYIKHNNAILFAGRLMKTAGVIPYYLKILRK